MSAQKIHNPFCFNSSMVETMLATRTTGIYFDRTGRGFGHGGGEPDAAALGDNDAVRAGGLCGSDDGAQIMRVLDVVADDDKGRLVAGLGKDVLHGGEVVAGGHGGHALMDYTAAQGVQLLRCGVFDGHAALLGQGDDLAHAAAVSALEDVDAVDGAAFFERLGDGVAACDDRTFPGVWFGCKFFGHC